MYQIKCDEYILYDPRDDELIVTGARCKLETNTVGEAYFTILPTHPYYDKLKKLKSVIEIKQDNDVIFRGRITNDASDFYNRYDVDVEGILACTNDTLIPPFNFPEDFADNADYQLAADTGNVVDYFLRWIIAQHNENAQPWQQLKVGNVSVSDPNNYITRSSDNYMKAWDVLRTRLFDSSLGGHLIVRYETDGNYIDYVDSFTLTNTQKITLGENLLDILKQSNAFSTYTALLPIGAEVDMDNGSYEGDFVTIVDTVRQKLTLESLPDGDLTSDIAKKDKYIYSKSAVAQYGWIVAPIEETTWDDVTTLDGLKNKSMEYLTGTAVLLSNTIKLRAVDLHFTDEQIQTFRMYRNVLVDLPVYNLQNASYPLTKLGIDILNPQNTDITLGESVRGKADKDNATQQNVIERIAQVANLVPQYTAAILDTVRQQLTEKETNILTTANEIILSALENYVETGAYDEFKQTIESEFKILAEQIEMNFTTTTQEIENVDGDLQQKFNQVYKHIQFSDNGITIGSSDSAITLEIDNDGIAFKKNGLQFGFWDGQDFLTGNIVVRVDERAQFGNFAFVPRSNGSLSFLKVGG